MGFFLQFANKNYFFGKHLWRLPVDSSKKSTPRHTSQRSGQATLISNITNEIKRVLLSTYPPIYVALQRATGDMPFHWPCLLFWVQRDLPAKPM